VACTASLLSGLATAAHCGCVFADGRTTVDIHIYSLRSYHTEMQTAQDTEFFRVRSSAQSYSLCSLPKLSRHTRSGGLLWWQELAQRWLGGPGVSCHVCPCDLYLLHSQTPVSRVLQMATICLRTSGHGSTLQAVNNASHCVVQELAHIASWLVKSSETTNITFD
jgi:hypothetical protein